MQDEPVGASFRCGLKQFESFLVVCQPVETFSDEFIEA